MIQSQKIFKQNKYVLINNMIPKEIAEIATQYSLYDRDRFFLPEDVTQQVPGTHSVYSDPLMETLLKFNTPRIEQLTGLKLWPTYSYYRLYKPGDILERHKDRPTCEISVTICLGYDYKDKKDYNWGIFVGPENGEKGTKGKMIPMKPGDGVIYRGCEIEHWREPFEAPEGAWQTQVFLHYVNQQEYNEQLKYDGRPSLGHYKKFKKIFKFE